MSSKEIAALLLVEVQTCTVTKEINMSILQKIENLSISKSSYATVGYHSCAYMQRMYSHTSEILAQKYSILTYNSQKLVILQPKIG